MTFKNQIFLTTLFVLTLSCGQKVDQNYTDNAGLKQGRWFIYGKDVPNSCYSSDQIVFDGYYKNNNKDSLWTEYYCNGEIKNLMTFSNGQPNGPYKLFDSVGKLKEEGVWTNGRCIPKLFYSGNKVSDKPIADTVDYSE